MSNNRLKSIEESVGVLIIAFRRADNVRKILEVSLEAGIKNFFVAIDVPKPEDSQAVLDSARVRDVISQFSQNNRVAVHLKIAERNLGCSVSVIAGCENAARRSRRRSTPEHAGTIRRVHGAGIRALCETDQGREHQSRMNRRFPATAIRGEASA